MALKIKPNKYNIKTKRSQRNKKKLHKVNSNIDKTNKFDNH